jgi:uroporphyrinogen decarboxylase
MNDRFLRALNRQPVDKTPIWIMRQAGRYLPEYRATREKAGDFLALCKNPELCCEVTMQPLERFDLDAAIIFSDILTIPDAMGLGLSLQEKIGPVFSRPITNFKEIKALSIPDPEQDLGYVMDAIRLTKKTLNGKVPLIGFAGSPWTLAAYMVEGAGSRDFAKVKKLAYGNPEAAHMLLNKLAESVTIYLEAQISAGADAVMIFDSWGGILSTDAYKTFSLYYMQLIIQKLAKHEIPTILFTKGGGLWLESLKDTKCTAVGLDWTTDISVAKKLIGSEVALQGNLDPAIMLTTPETVSEEAKKILDKFGRGSGHVFNLGHGITPEVSPENVEALVSTVHSYSEKFHGQKK